MPTEDEQPQAIGPGNGGPAVGTATQATLRDTDGHKLGTIEYDAAYFVNTTAIGTPAAPGPNDPILPDYPIDSATPPAFTMGVVGNDAEGLHMFLVLIAGRPDTPCRFQAALAARDQGFTIWGDGADVLNGHGLEFHEVVISRGKLYVRLDCALLSNNLGIEVITQSTPAGRLGSRQVHFVLNSIRP